MIKRTLALLLVTALLLASLPAAAQDAPAWVAHLFNQSTGTINRVAPDGTALDTLSLPLPEGYNSYGYDIAVHGSMVAYLAFQLEDNMAPPASAAVVIYDALNDVITGVYPLDPRAGMEGVNAAAASLTFLGDGMRLVFGYYFGEGETFSTAVLALDLQGNVVTSLEGALLADITGADAAYFVQVFGDYNGEVFLRLEPVFVHQELTPVMMVWGINMDAFQVQPYTVHPNGDVLPARIEAITPALDPNFTAIERPASDGLDLPPFNVVQRINFQQQETSVLYHAADAEIITAKYVSGGALVLVTLDNRSGGLPLARLVTLEGAVVAEMEASEGVFRAVSTPDGYIARDGEALTFTTANADGVKSTITVVTEGFASDVVISIP